MFNFLRKLFKRENTVYFVLSGMTPYDIEIEAAYDNEAAADKHAADIDGVVSTFEIETRYTRR